MSRPFIYPHGFLICQTHELLSQQRRRREAYRRNVVWQLSVQVDS